MKIGPGLDELERWPQRTADLSPEERAAVILRCVAVIAAVASPLIIPTNRSEQEPASPYLRGDEAAAYTRMKKTRLDEWRRGGCVRAVKLGKEYGYRRGDLDDFMGRLAEAQAVPCRFMAFILPERVRLS